jgi:hypothetical protein
MSNTENAWVWGFADKETKGIPMLRHLVTRDLPTNCDHVL